MLGSEKLGGSAGRGYTAGTQPGSFPCLLATAFSQLHFRWERADRENDKGKVRAGASPGSSPKGAASRHSSL